MKANNEWPLIRLGDIAKIIHGWPFKSDFCFEELTGQPIVVNIGNFQYSGGFRFDSTTLREYRSSYPKGYELSPDSILLIMTCQTPGGEILGIPGKIPDDGRKYLHNQRLGKVHITAPDRVISDFLYWVFLWKEFNEELVATASGTKILHTAPSRIENFSFLLPSLPEQYAIARILGALDDKIAVNREMNRTLEGMAQALFKSWFVDFDPVQAKRDGRKPFGMTAETAELFPSHFENSELGPIPKGWQVSDVGSEFKLTMGQSPPGTSYNEDGIGKVFYQGRTDFGFRYPSLRMFTTAPSKMAYSGDTLVSVRAPVGDINMALQDCCIGRGLAAVRHYSNKRSYTYYMMWSLSPDFSVFESEGTLFGAINGQAFRALNVIKPSPEILDEFEKICGVLDAEIENIENENKTLISLRNTLLPKLLSGEIRIRDAERQIEAAI